MEIFDLTHSLSSEVPCWDGDCGYNLSIETDYKDCSGIDLFRTQKITTRAGMGTHIDAPAHCFSGGKTVDLINLQNLITNCAVIKVDDVADENFVIMPDKIHQFEKSHGTIKPNTFILFFTGWSKYWDQPSKYRNNLIFPSVHENTAKLLLERDISGLGTDTLSADARGESFPVHRAILGAGKYLVENVANAGNLPPRVSNISVLPIKIKGGTEAPVRLVAFV